MGEERHQTPAHHLDKLLARSQNPFDVSDAALHRLRSAVMFRVELYGWRHRNTPQPTLRCSSFRHVFLLADGSSLLLWELCYDSEDGAGDGGEPGTELCEVYDCEESLRRSERRVHRRMGGDCPGPAEGAGAADEGEPDDEVGADGAGCPEEGAGREAWEEYPYGFGDVGGAHGPGGDADGSEGASGSEGPEAFEGRGVFGHPLFDGSPFDPPPFGQLPFGQFGELPFEDAPFRGSIFPDLPFPGASLPDSSARDSPFEDRRFDDPVFENVAFGEPGTDDHETGLDRDLDDDLDPVAERGGGPGRVSFEFLSAATGAGSGRREYAERGSPDHARRLLRRAENEDRPGDEILRLLDTALGHQILHVPGPLARAGECHVWCSVYEHAFLLADGSEISLYELEHNLSATGRLVCEVYLDESVAGEAAYRLARDRGIDL